MKTLLFTLLMGMSLTLAAMEVRTIHLDHRTPQEVIEKLDGLLPASANVKPFDNRIVLYSDKATYEAVVNMLEDIDQPQTSIDVQVLRTQRQLQETHRRQDRVEVDSQRGAEVSTKRYSTRDSRERDQLYRARGIAGEPMMINTGEMIPQDDQQIYLRPDGVIALSGTTSYINLQNGFQTVVSLLADNRLQAKIYPSFSEQTRSDVIETTEMATTITGRVGEWIELGRAGESSAHYRGSHRHYRSDRDEAQYIYLKIERN